MTKPNVFIVESLEREDEAKRRDGRILRDFLNLDGKATQYHYIRTAIELKKILHEFEKSEYRYLHLSCHGNRSAIFTTYERIGFAEFGKIIRPYLDERRVFISACWIVNASLAREVFKDGECISLIGPNYEIDFGDVAIAWATFYHLMFKADRKRMTGTNISPTLRRIKRAFGIPLTYYSRDQESELGYRRVKWDI